MTAPNSRPRWKSTDLAVAVIDRAWVAISEKGDEGSPTYLELLRLNPTAARRLATELIAGAQHIETEEHNA